MPFAEFSMTPFTPKGRADDFQELVAYVNRQMTALTRAIRGPVSVDLGTRVVDTVIDLHLYDLVFVTAGADITLALSTAVRPGARATIVLKQDATGGRTVTWSGVTWNAGVPPALLTTAGTAYALEFIFTPDEAWQGFVSDAPDSITRLQLKDGEVIAGKLAIDAVEANNIVADVLSNEDNTAGVLFKGALPGTWTRYLNLLAEGLEPFLKHPQLELNADGSATFSGTVSVAQLSEISSDAGILVAGRLQSLDGTRYLDLDAGGTDPFLQHPSLSLNADGSATFSGTVSVAALSEIVDNLGIVVSGILQNPAGTAAIRLDNTDALPVGATTFLDLDPVGPTDPILQHPALSLNADGSAEFSGTVSVAQLSDITDVLGIIVSGILRNALGTAAIRLDAGDVLPGTATTYLDLAATGTDPVLQHPAFRLRANGDAEFDGDITWAQIPDRPTTFGPNLVVTPTVTATDVSIAFTFDGDLEVYEDGVLMAPDPTSPLVVPRDSDDHTYVFLATRDGQTVPAVVNVPAEKAAAPTDPSIDSVNLEGLFAPSDGGGSFDVVWATSNMPPGVTYDVAWEVTAGSFGPPSSGTEVGVTSPATISAPLNSSPAPEARAVVTAKLNGVVIATNLDYGLIAA